MMNLDIMIEVGDKIKIREDVYSYIDFDKKEYYLVKEVNASRINKKWQPIIVVELNGEDISIQINEIEAVRNSWSDYNILVEHDNEN